MSTNDPAAPALTAYERLSLVLEYLGSRPLIADGRFVCVHPRNLDHYQRCDPSGMPAKPHGAFDGDWSEGLPDDVRKRLRAIQHAKYKNAPAPLDAYRVARDWADTERRRLAIEAKLASTREE